MTADETREAIQHLRSEWIKAQNRHEELSKQYTQILQELEASRNKMASLEKERLDLERTLVEVKKCKPHEKATRKKQPTKVDVRQLVSTWSEEERQALIAALSAM